MHKKLKYFYFKYYLPEISEKRKFEHKSFYYFSDEYLESTIYP
jgi:hypothetical protein